MTSVIALVPGAETLYAISVVVPDPDPGRVGVTIDGMTDDVTIEGGRKAGYARFIDLA